ncbi:MAG: MBL fold metallo-hydrolase [Hyphomicrobiales bacterium]|nr:MBL fold metallo-hydrolase [Hyphomicrobiales bacterium]MCP5000804.1 MBL fold metallo-hydrolase [Hyphomicrobiales bacterium]
MLEMNAPFLMPEELFPTAGPDVRDIVNAHVPGQLCPGTGRLILPVQGFLLKTPSHTILVDSCVGNDKTVPGNPNWNKRSDNRFLAALTAAGVGPADIDYVLCTHLHTDHVGWNTKLEDGRWVPTFANARYLMPAADDEVFRQRAGDSYVESVLPVIKAGQAELVTPGHMLGDCVTLIATPGHTPGHVSIMLKSGDSEAVITGDALHSTVQCWRPDWLFKYDMDGEMAVASRRRLLEEVSESRRIVLGGHFVLPSIGRVKAEGNVFRWEED